MSLPDMNTNLEHVLGYLDTMADVAVIEEEWDLAAWYSDAVLALLEWDTSLQCSLLTAAYC